jgi:hypothetical protein
MGIFAKYNCVLHLHIALEFAVVVEMESGDGYDESPVSVLHRTQQ